MDIKYEYKNEFEFLDLSGLDDKTKVEINVFLNSGAETEILQLPWDTGEADYFQADVTQLDPESGSSWLNYNTEQSQMRYEGEMETSATAIMSPIPPTHMYSHPPRQIMPPVYGGIVLAQPNVYEIGPESGMHPYVSGHYGQSIYHVPGTEIHEMPPPQRDNRNKRNYRQRGGRRDTNSSYIDPNNVMSSGYFPPQGQYHRLSRNMCSQTMYYQTEHASNPRQRTYYPSQTSMYNPSLSHPAYNQVSQHSAAGSHWTRHSPAPPTPRQRPDLSKNLIKKSGDPSPRPAASTYGPPPLSIQRKPEIVSSSQTNIDCHTTVIVNNSKTEHGASNEASECVSSNNNNLNSTNNSDVSNGSNNSGNNNSNNSIKVPPVNVTIEHNSVTTVNKSCELSEKADVPFVNINSSIQVKQNTENTVELCKETVSAVQTNLPEFGPEPEPELEPEPESEPELEPVPEPKPEPEPEPVTKDEPQEEIVKTSISETVQTPEPSNAPAQIPITPAASVTPESGISWAGLFKKSSNEPFASGITNGKPTARINPIRVDVLPDSDTFPKLNSSPNEAPGTRQLHGKPRAFTPIETSNNESMASSRTEAHEEYNASNKFDDLDAHKTGEFLLKYQMEKQTVSLLPRGLINRSNYCYINSILQALLACPPFYNLLVALPYSKNTTRHNTSNNLTTNMIRFVHEFSPLAAGARLARKDRAQKRSDEAVVHIQSGIAFEPTYVYTMLKNTSCASVFSVEGRQEDAEEFLSCLLNGISDEMLEMMKLGSNESTPITSENESMQQNHGEQEEWKIMGPKNKGSITRCTEFGRTPLSDIFRGQLRYRVSRAGEQPTDNVQPFFTLQLDIEKAESVEGALEILVGRDQLEGMTCSKTKREIEAWKQVTLEELPVILILHLKWFDYKLDGCSKILKSVEFPIDLKIDNKTLSSNASKKLSLKQKQYKLFAVTYHDGKEATKGHYVTDAFHVGYGGWVRYDDSSLRGVSEQSVLNPSPPRVPYLLYYRRLDTIGNNQTSNDRIR